MPSSYSSSDLVLHSRGVGGKSAASPRSSVGSVLAARVNRGRPFPPGNTPALRSGSTTTGHSRPFALCTVSSFTLSPGDGAAVSRPRSNSSAARR